MSNDIDISEVLNILKINYTAYGNTRLYSLKDTLRLLDFAKIYPIDLRGITAMRKDEINGILIWEMDYSFNFYNESFSRASGILSELDESYLFELDDIEGMIEFINRTYF